MGNNRIVYSYGDGIYVNLTNKCSNRCEFCVRNMIDGLGDAECLWLDKEPTSEEVVAELKKWPIEERGEVIFCGYGEPMERLEALLKISKWVKENTSAKVRINTNGQGDLINGHNTAKQISGVIDAVSVSLNQCTNEKYQNLCHSEFEDKAYPAVIKFIEEVQNYVGQVAVTAVSCISPEDMEACRRIAKDLGVTFRAR